jgi:hypothetical protein
MAATGPMIDLMPLVNFWFPLSGLLATSGNFAFGNITALAGLQDDSLRLGHNTLLTEWKPSYKRGVAMQAPLAIIGSSWDCSRWQTGRWLWMLWRPRDQRRKP